ncbi:pantetheine-phosphate adenylyltransferase [Rudaeicoccus suwonensis]|uniref:Phosphopantetheine adenylyltransferase n=1 Tax=Rudaeicoccus suwonensis TaxID=657409 RepID=A0A561E9E3_9MICO|nr:pantetheine-phosphate adenylyltransferase [Rudaeicoccus suwonensis]TWE12235.1 phosphopantetheine adenylyltransferase [Rudaeicoccus suwonensis]
MSGDPRRCVCPGSYDPITNGHLDVITRASRLYDEVVVAVLHNPAKQGTFTPAERVDLIERSCSQLPNVRAQAYGDRLIVDVCREVGAAVLVKGIRDATDIGYEWPMALMNRQMADIETLMLPGDPRFGHYSSSLIRLIAGHGADVAEMVPPPVLQPLLERVRS